MNQPPPFPVDDSTLLALEHACGATLTYEDEAGIWREEPRVIGADYQLGQLCDFLAGATEDGDTSFHHTDVILALVAEIRHLRSSAPGASGDGRPGGGVIPPGSTATEAEGDTP